MSYWEKSDLSKPKQHTNKQTIDLRHLPDASKPAKMSKIWIVIIVLTVCCVLAATCVPIIVIWRMGTSSSSNANNNYSANTTTANTTTNTTTSATTTNTTTSACTSMFSSIWTTIASNNPYQVAAADFNNDGKMDIAISSYVSNVGGILLGNSSGLFGTQITFSTNSPEGIVTADFNGDGNADVAVTNTGTNTLELFLGSGTGTVTSQGTFTVGNYPYALATGDVNSDSHLDVVVANFFGNSISVLLGDGTGNFATQLGFVVDTAAGPRPNAVALGDFNNDGHLDVTVANSNTNNIGVLLGVGNGSYSAPTTYSTGSGSTPYGVATADFNGDGHIDIAYCLSGSNQVGIMLGSSTGSFTMYAVYSAGSGASPYGIVVADFNQDTNMDVAVANRGGGNIGVFLGTGTGTFGAPTAYSVSGSPYALGTADFNQDAKPDIVAAILVSAHMNVLLKQC